MQKFMYTTDNNGHKEMTIVHMTLNRNVIMLWLTILPNTTIGTIPLSNLKLLNTK